MAEVELKYKIAFASVRGMGYDLANKILDIIPSEESFFEMTEKDLAATLQVKNRIIDKDYRLKLISNAEKEIDFIEKNDIGVTYFTDDEYPTRLRDAQDAPLLLYHKGDIGCFNAGKMIEPQMAQSTQNQGLVEGLLNGLSAMQDKAVNMAVQVVLPNGEVLAETVFNDLLNVSKQRGVSLATT